MVMRNPAPSVTSIGVNVWNGRLPGATTFGCRVSRTNPAPRFCSTTPVSGSTSIDPNVANRLWIQLTALPFASTAMR